MSEKPTKTWQKIKVFDTYSEADELKSKLQNTEGNSDLEIKIRRCGPMGTQFKVKTHRPKTNK
tara:strand:+ start:2422 stop:2610 length:189 start_codon:yes stop_codon:yes gene_type:complete